MTTNDRKVVTIVSSAFVCTSGHRDDYSLFIRDRLENGNRREKGRTISSLGLRSLLAFFLKKKTDGELGLLEKEMVQCN